jgi:tryptophanyl-tRNA synthetase
MDKRVFSGIKPSGRLHLGNYIGAINQWVDSQSDGLNIFCVVDLHAITVDQDPKELHLQSLQLVAFLLAAGIDPKKSLLFVQSQNPDHANLGWVLNCFLTMGQMNRMTQYKEKSDGKESVSVGLFDYPALMAADILLYDTTHVPVGEDQKQHVELARDVAERFNSRLGETFVLPEPQILSVGGRVMSLTNPEKKMSKSITDPKGTIDLLDTPEAAREKILHATTDSENRVSFDESRPGVSNLLSILSSLSGKSVQELEKEFTGVGYKDFKLAVADEVGAFLGKLQEKYQHFMSEDVLSPILAEGRDKAYDISHKKLSAVFDKIGFLN